MRAGASALHLQTIYGQIAFRAQRHRAFREVSEVRWGGESDGEYTYELIRDFLKLPNGETFGLVSRVATDAGPRLRVPAQGPPGGGVRPRREIPRRLGHRRGHRSARAENRRRRRLHHRSLRLGREVVHAGRQALLELGQRGVHSDTGCTGRHWLARARGGAVQSSDRDDGPPQRRHLRDRRLPQRPRAPLHARRPAGHVMGHAGQGRGPVPPAAQHRVRP